MRLDEGVRSRSLSLPVTSGPPPSTLDDALRENAALRAENAALRAEVSLLREEFGVLQALVAELQERLRSRIRTET
ncbi:MAG TPA: hypothetical protein VFS21_06605 [Roseiflexaceae bacterium]|nr:hypothetical protein [Roseiflexaceae bacterium]